MKIEYTDELTHWEVRGQTSGNRYRADTGNKGRFGFAPRYRYEQRGDGVEEIQRVNRYQERVSFKRPNAANDGYDTIYTGTRYTPAGQRRLDYETSLNNARPSKKKLDQEALEDASRWVRDDYSNLENVAKSTRDLGGSVSQLGSMFKIKPNQRIDLSDMTDAELSAILNRERMERSYNEMFNPPKENKGKEFVQGAGNFLAASGNMALTGLQIAQVIRGFAGK